jgi:hypothetical protein
MEVRRQATPNPNAMKFVLPGRRFSQSQNYATAAAAADHLLAAQLFRLEGVTNVFLAQDFVTVNKRPDVAWENLVDAAAALIGGYFDR